MMKRTTAGALAALSITPRTSFPWKTTRRICFVSSLGKQLYYLAICYETISPRIHTDTEYTPMV